MSDMAIFGGLMGAGMISQGIFGYLGASAQANAQENIAQYNAGALQAITESNNQARVDIAEERYDFMWMAAQQQYQLGLRQIQMQERQDGLQAMMWREQLRTDLDKATLFYNAQILAFNQGHEENMEEIENAHEEKMAELDQPVVQEVNLEDVPLG